jgi:hypothetical protein
VAALDHGIKRLAEGSPLSNRLLREMRTVLSGQQLGRPDGSGRCARARGRQQAWYAVEGNIVSTIAEEARW